MLIIPKQKSRWLGAQTDAFLSSASAKCSTAFDFNLSLLVAAHDLHDDAGDHKGDDEEDDVEGYAHYVHEMMQVISGL
jgi:hypothetical protein